MNRTVPRGHANADPFDLWDRPVPAQPARTGRRTGTSAAPRRCRRASCSGPRVWGIDLRNRRLLGDGALLAAAVLLLTAAVLGSLGVTAFIR